MRAFLLSFLGVFVACAHGSPTPAQTDEDSDAVADFEAATEDPKEKGESSVSVTYAKTAQENWRRGEEEFADEEYAAAQKYYSYIRTKFPYSSFALKSELRIADCLFARERYLEAINAYTNFQRLHPTHADAPYASFRTGAAHHAQIPGEWFFLPSPDEKDQTAIKEAARTLAAYVERYPNDAHIEEGRKLLLDARTRLVRHERLVADFYKKHDKPKAYVGRLRTIHDRYGDLAADAPLLAEMIEAYVELLDRANAAQFLGELKTRFPGWTRLVELEAMVARLPITQEQNAPQPTSPPEPDAPVPSPTTPSPPSP